MVDQELFVHGARDFGLEDGVIVVRVRIRPNRIPTVHAVARLVREGKDVAQAIVLIVQQDVRRSVIPTGGERPRALALVFIAIDPASA